MRCGHATSTWWPAAPGRPPCSSSSARCCRTSRWPSSILAPVTRRTSRWNAEAAKDAKKNNVECRAVWRRRAVGHAPSTGRGRIRTWNLESGICNAESGIRELEARNRMRFPVRLTSRRAGAAIVGAIALLALAAPFVAPHAVDARFDGFLNAPPTVPHVRDAAGGWHAPFVYPWILVSQLEQRYEQDRASPVALRWLTGGRLVQSSGDARAPLL